MPSSFVVSFVKLNCIAFICNKGLRNENLDRWLKKEGKDINLWQNLVNIMKNEYNPFYNDEKQVENLKRGQALYLMMANNAGNGNFSH